MLFIIIDVYGQSIKCKGQKMLFSTCFICWLVELPLVNILLCKGIRSSVGRIVFDQRNVSGGSLA